VEHLIAGQKVSKEFRERARALRREMTEAERILWANVRSHRLQGKHFRRQQVIGGYIVDFYCEAARLVVEVDGPIHERQTDYDVERGRVLSAYGITVLRVSNDEVMNHLSSVLTRIARRLGLDCSLSDGESDR
jgi:very-short-patch-repair endonuclease